MSSRTVRCQCPTLIDLEGRLALSTVVPSNAIGSASGTVTGPGAVAQVATTVVPKNLTRGKASTVLVVGVAPAGSSDLVPQVVAATGPGGVPYRVQPGAPYRAGVHGEATVYLNVNKPGPLTLSVTGAGATSGGFTATTYLPGDANGDGQVNFADLAVFARAFPSTSADTSYNPAADANRNGQVGLEDAKLMEQNFPAQAGPAGRPRVVLHLAPGEQEAHPGISNSGGITHQPDITILGHTTPGSIVLSDDPKGYFSFSGPAVPTDPGGNFQIRYHLTSPFTNTEFLVIDPSGHQTIAAFPVYFEGPTAPR